jgi:hypothetical protein
MLYGAWGWEARAGERAGGWGRFGTSPTGGMRTSSAGAAATRHCTAGAPTSWSAPLIWWQVIDSAACTQFIPTHSPCGVDSRRGSGRAPQPPRAAPPPRSLQSVCSGGGGAQTSPSGPAAAMHPGQPLACAVCAVASSLRPSTARSGKIAPGRLQGLKPPLAAQLARQVSPLARMRRRPSHQLCMHARAPHAARMRRRQARAPASHAGRWRACGSPARRRRRPAAPHPSASRTTPASGCVSQLPSSGLARSR